MILKLITVWTCALKFPRTLSLETSQNDTRNELILKRLSQLQPTETAQALSIFALTVEIKQR